MSTFMRFKFWAICGLMVVVAAAGFFLVYMRLAARNRDNVDKTVKSTNEVKQLAREGVRGKDWREPMDSKLENLRAQETAVEQLRTRGTWEVVVGEIIDWRGLALKMAGHSAEESPVAIHLMSQLPADLRVDIKDVADGIKASMAKGEAIEPAVGAAAKMAFVFALNDILASDDFYVQDLFEGAWLMGAQDEELAELVADLYVRVPEAVEEGTSDEGMSKEEVAAERQKQIDAGVLKLKSKRQRIETQLARRDELSDSDRVWLNRLLLDAALPRHIADSSRGLKFAAPFEYEAVKGWRKLYGYEGFWRDVYRARVDEVYDLIERNFLGHGGRSTMHVISVGGPGTMDPGRRGGRYEGSRSRTTGTALTVPQMEWQERAYWIQRYIVRALANLNNVPRAGEEQLIEAERLSINAQAMEEDRYTVPIIEEIRFARQPERLLRDIHGTAFVPQALTVTVIMRGRYLERVIEGLKEEVPTLEVTGVSIRRFGQRTVDRGRDERVRDRYEFDEPEMEGEPSRRDDRTPRNISIDGVTVFPFGRKWQVPAGSRVQLNDKLVRVALSVYVKDGDPDAAPLELGQKKPDEEPGREGEESEPYDDPYRDPYGEE